MSIYYPKGGKCNPSDIDDYAMTRVTVGASAPTTVKPAKKGTAPGTIVYLVIHHNAYQHISGTGYQIIKITIK